MRGQIASYKIFPFSRYLVSNFNKLGRSIAISGSPYESLVPLIKYLGFDELKATALETKDDCYTGGVLLNLAIGSAKSDIIEEVIKHGIDETRFLCFW